MFLRRALSITGNCCLVLHFILDKGLLFGLNPKMLVSTEHHSRTLEIVQSLDWNSKCLWWISSKVCQKRTEVKRSSFCLWRCFGLCVLVYSIKPWKRLQDILCWSEMCNWCCCRDQVQCCCSSFSGWVHGTGVQFLCSFCPRPCPVCGPVLY